MNIANLGAFGAGLVRGDITAREQRRAEEDQAFQNEQRVQLRDQWARDKEERDAVAGVQRPGVYRDPQAILDQDFTQSDAIPSRTVTDADFARGLSRAYKYSPDKAVAALNTANQFDERQYMLHQRKVTDAALRAQQLIDSGDHIGGMRHLSEVYKTINDGKDIVETAGPNGEPLFGVAQAGRYIQPPQAVTPELARQAVWSALKFATPEMFKTVSSLENQNITAKAAKANAEAANISAGAHVISANAGARQADTMEGYRQYQEERGNKLLPGEINYQDAQIRHLNAQSAAAGAQANAAKMGSPIPYRNPDGSEGIGIPVLTKGGGFTVQPVQLPTGATLFPKTTGARDISFKDFAAAASGALTGIPDRATGKDTPFDKLSLDQQMQLYERFRSPGSPGSRAGGLPDVKAPGASQAGIQRPVVVQPGETRMTAPGTPVMGDPANFLRESSRGLFGGVNYQYRDPVTNRAYSVDEYNRLLGQ